MDELLESVAGLVIRNEVEREEAAAAQAWPVPRISLERFAPVDARRGDVPDWARSAARCTQHPPLDELAG